MTRAFDHFEILPMPPRRAATPADLKRPTGQAKMMRFETGIPPRFVSIPRRRSDRGSKLLSKNLAAPGMQRAARAGAQGEPERKHLRIGPARDAQPDGARHLRHHRGDGDGLQIGSSTPLRS